MKPLVAVASTAVALFLVPAAAPASDAAAQASVQEGPATGSISGSVEVGDELASRRIRFHLYPDLVRDDQPAERTTPQDEARNVVIYLERLDRPDPGAAKVASSRSEADSSIPTASTGMPHVMRQEDLSFEPQVLAVRRGETVEFPNADPIFHNVFSLSKAATFDLGRYPSGSSRSVRFDEPGIVKVFCHIHSDMTGIIYVFDHPHFATPDVEGRYLIDGVPPGEYRLVAWHERIRPLSTKVKIEAGKKSVVDFTIPLREMDSGG